jgi:uncharacterized protein (TIGR02466 family)
MTPRGPQACFSVPIVDRRLPGWERLNPLLHERFLAWEKNEGARTSVPTTVPKQNVYESDFSLFNRRDPVVSELAQTCLNALGELIMDINRYDESDMRNLRIYHHSWYHITRDGGYTSAHNHPMASWSGVYCVAPGEADPDIRNNGALRFFDPRPNPSMYLDAGNARLQPPFASGNLAWQLTPGELLLFPSWLTHDVSPFRGTGERITVAFNAWVREAGAAVDEPGIRVADGS